MRVVCVCFAHLHHFTSNTISFVFHRNDLVFLNLIRKYMTSTKSNFRKAKTLLTSVKWVFVSTKWFTQCNSGSVCVQITGGVDMSLYVFVNLLVTVSCIGHCILCVGLFYVWYWIRVQRKITLVVVWSHIQPKK